MQQPHHAVSAATEHVTLVDMLDLVTASDSRGTNPELFGRYRVLGLLGVGGMGTVYRVWDSTLEEEVALKMLRPELVSAPGMLARFRQEVKLARRVSHRNVVRTYDLSEVGESVFLTMEFIRGRSLRRALAEDGPLQMDMALDLARQALSGILAAHNAGVLHCDLKPDNILLGEMNRVAITDFGISRVLGSERGSVAGTLAYMAPEQAMVGEVDGRADLYSLGVVLYEALTGKGPWAETELRKQPALRIAHAAPDPRHVAAVPDPLAELVMRLLAPRAEQRHASADAVLAALDEVVTMTTRRALTPVTASVPTAGVPSLAVLPFHDAGEGAERHLADGLTEEVIDALSATRGLRVRPLAATLRHRGAVDATEVGRALQVEAVVEGTVRRRGGELVLAVRLTGVADGFQLWAKRFRCDEGDALQIADEVARAVAAALATELGAKTHVGPLDPAMLDLYLRARQTMRTGWDRGAAEAVLMLDQVLERNPDEPNALAVYAMAMTRKAFFEQQEGAALTSTLTRVRQCANRAVARAPEFGDAWLALATANLYTGAIPDAARSLREAVRRAPGLSRAQQMLGGMALEVGRSDEAIERLQAALSIDPEAVQARGDLVRAYAYIGRWDAADALLAAGTRQMPQANVLAFTAARLSIWAPGRSFIEPDLRGDTSASAVLLGEVLGFYRHLREHHTAPPDLEASAQGAARGDLALLRAVRAQLGAEMLCYVGEVDRAADAVGRAVAAGLYDVNWMDRCPLLEPLRAHPAWPALHRDVAARAAEIRAAIEGR